jgi:hypothetical protein
MEAICAFMHASIHSYFLLYKRASLFATMTSIVEQHLFESRMFFYIRDNADDTPKLGLRRIKSAGDLPSPIHAPPKVDVGASPPEASLPVLLGSQAAETCTHRKAPRRRRNRSANKMVEGKGCRASCQWDPSIDGLANALKDARSSQAVFTLASQNMARFDFELFVLAIHVAAKHAAANPPMCTPSNIVHALVQRVHSGLLAMSSPSADIVHLLTEALYAFAKLDVNGFQSVIYDILKAVPPFSHQCSTVELSIALWSLGRLAPAEAPSTNMTREARRLAVFIMGHIAKRPLEEVTPHCMSEVLYTTTRLELQGKEVQDFFESCKGANCQRASLHDFTAQGLANIAWALAKTHVKRGVTTGKSTGRVSLKIINDARGRLASFEMLELSMTAWAVAKLHAQNEGGLMAESLAEVGTFISAVADVSVRRFELMSSQSISNVARALAKLDRMNDASARSFFTEAMRSLIARPFEFSPQAISNLCYAVSWLNSRTKARTTNDSRLTMQAFAEVAASQCLLREFEFKWLDLSDVLVAIAPRFRQDDAPLGLGPHTRKLAENLASRLVHEGHSLATQVGLNVAVVASRIGLDTELLRQVTEKISSVIAGRTPRVNAHDLRQFSELRGRLDAEMQTYC